ncbi:MAG: glycosyltransferase family 4 protein [Actinomycetota bacterium]|nr:glycosyltransferase family 4 protein [Actinomycetota bacterium]
MCRRVQALSHRIAHVISTRGMGGAERFLATLAVAGHARGHEQVVLNPFATAPSKELAALCDPVPYEGYGCDSVIEVPKLHRWLQGRLASFRPDIVHAVLFHALVATSVRKQSGSRYLLSNVYGEGMLTAPNGRVLRVVDRAATRRFDRVVAISENVRRFVVDQYGVPDAKVTCIPLGWRGNPKPPSTDPRPPTVICVAALRPEKGHDVLLAAFTRLRQAAPDARLVLVGQGVMEEPLRAQAAASGDTANIDFLGAVDDIWEHLARADIFAIASRAEAFGIAIAEAMAAGLPVVAPDVGAISELVTPGVTGELFPAGDAEAMGEHLVRLVTSTDRRQAMSDAALAAAQPLRIENAVERYFDVYDELLVRQRLG